MKHLANILFLLFIFQQSPAQDVDSLHKKIIGTWELINYLSTNNGTGNEGPDKIKRIKDLKQSNYMLSLYDLKSEKLIAEVSGSYSLSATESKEFNYEEKVIDATHQLVPPRSQIKKSVSIDEGDRMIFIWTDNLIKYTEIWSRVAEKDRLEKHSAHKNTE
jgi:hypothetical protein